MLSAPIGGLLKDARRQLGLSREELAKRGGLSTRLVAELERGQRPNVSLESALQLLRIVGVSVSLSAPALEREARAARRRQTWTGRQVRLHDESDDSYPVHSPAAQLGLVAEVSKQAYVVASAKKRRATRRPGR